MADIIATWKDIFAGFVCINSASGYGTADINAVVTALESVCGGATTDDIELGLTRCPTKAEIESMAFWCPESDWTLDSNDISDFCNYYSSEAGDNLYGYNKLVGPSDYASNELVPKTSVIGKESIGWQFKYLQTNGSAYIPLGVTLATGDIIIISYYIGSWGSSYGTAQSPLGTIGNCGFYTYWDYTTTMRIEQRNGLYRRYNRPAFSTYKSTGVYVMQRMVVAGLPSTMSYSVSNTTPFTLSGVDPGNLTVSSWSYSPTLTTPTFSGQLTAFACNSSGAEKVLSGGRIYGIEIYRDSSLYRQYVPALHVDYGFYEKKTNTLYKPSAGTVTGAGGTSHLYIDQPNYLNQIGTLE